MSRLLLIFILYGFLLPSTTYSQEITPEEERTFDIEQFTLPGGRLGNNVNSIVQGPNGFMWFGSHGGVHRYDGYEFVTYKNVAWDTIGETTTLSYPYVENLFWDSHDKLWISTYGNGIYLFDPDTEIFKHYPYDADNPGSVSHPRVLSAVEDNQGRMWFGTERGLNRLDPENQTFIKYFADPDDPNSLVNDDIRKLYLDKQGILWIGSGFAGFEARVNGSLSRYNPDSDNFTNFYEDEGELAGLDYSAARAIAEDSHGNFWVGTANGLNRVDKDKGTFELMKYDPGFPFAPGARDRVEPIVYSVLEDNSGGLWVGTVMAPNYPTHLLRYDYETQTSQVFPVQTSIWDMTQSADGTIWTAGAGVSGQVLRITPKSATYDLQGGDFYAQEFITSPLKAQFGIPINFFMRGPLSMTIDESNGDIWTTHSCLIQGGNYLFLAKYNPTSTKTQFFHLTTLPGQIDQSLFDNNWSTSGMAIDKKGRIWCSYIYDGVGLFSFDPQSNQVEHYLHDPADSTTISSDFIIRIIMDRNGDIWAGTGGTGLNRINPETGQITRYNFDIPETFDSNGWVISLLEARDGKIWASGELHDGGTPIIVIIDPENNDVSRLHLPLGNSFYSIRFMTQSPITGNVFFITEGGELWNFHPDTGKFNFFGQQGSPLPIEAIATLVCDDSGTFWASGANSGEFVRFGESFDYEKFFSREGYPNRRRHGMVGPDGQIYFINAQGWIHIDPKNLNLKSVADSSHLKLVDLYLLGKKQIPGKDYALPRPAPMMDAIELKHDAETFSFRYSIFNYHDDNIQFEYRLYPFENLWKITNLPVANYFRIPSGDYQFQVRHFNYSGASNENMLDIPVKILPPWWKTWLAYLMYGILLILAGLGVHRIQKERVIRAERNRNREKELAHAREIEKAYTDLKNTQAQLLQSEKMASLGELTAGIAHEIQNPLNFVNNFSEVNAELLTELKEEIKQKNYDEVESIAESLEENEQKIIHHGHRAGAIVKSMLQHSRKSKGEREEVDLNDLVDEYLRLAYHGMRAKDKTFNADMHTEFDKDLGKLKVVPQDIGRVVLNLITNAFYAVHEKKQKSNGVYKPVVTVKTKQENGKVELEVADNGTGMTKEIANKIFQPFFTTKPTGEGTGLGLSLSYDIIKAHGGDLTVDSKLGEGSKFVIELPG